MLRATLVVLAVALGVVHAQSCASLSDAALSVRNGKCQYLQKDGTFKAIIEAALIPSCPILAAGVAEILPFTQASTQTVKVEASACCPICIKRPVAECSATVATNNLVANLCAFGRAAPWPAVDKTALFATTSTLIPACANTETFVGLNDAGVCCFKCRPADATRLCTKESAVAAIVSGTTCPTTVGGTTFYRETSALPACAAGAIPTMNEKCCPSCWIAPTAPTCAQTAIDACKAGVATLPECAPGVSPKFDTATCCYTCKPPVCTAEKYAACQALAKPPVCAADQVPTRTENCCPTCIKEGVCTEEKKAACLKLIENGGVDICAEGQQPVFNAQTCCPSCIVKPRPVCSDAEIKNCRDNLYPKLSVCTAGQTPEIPKGACCPTCRVAPAVPRSATENRCTAEKIKESVDGLCGSNKICAPGTDPNTVFQRDSCTASCVPPRLCCDRATVINNFKNARECGADEQPSHDQDDPCLPTCRRALPTCQTACPTGSVCVRNRDAAGKVVTSCRALARVKIALEIKDAVKNVLSKPPTKEEIRQLIIDVVQRYCVSVDADKKDLCMQSVKERIENNMLVEKVEEKATTTEVTVAVDKDSATTTKRQATSGATTADLISQAVADPTQKASVSGSATVEKEAINSNAAASVAAVSSVTLLMLLLALAW